MPSFYHKLDVFFKKSQEKIQKEKTEHPIFLDTSIQTNPNERKMKDRKKIQKSGPSCAR